MKKFFMKSVAVSSALVMLMTIAPMNMVSAKSAKTAKPTIKISKLNVKKKKLEVKLKTSKNTKKVKIYIDGKAKETKKKKFKSFSISISKLKAGKHTLKVKAYTKYNKTKSASKFFTVKKAGSSSNETPSGVPYGTYEAPKAASAPTIDGNGSDACWADAPWAEIRSNWLNDAAPSAADFSGKYKIVWDENRVYFLAEITDDVFVESDKAPTDNYPSYDLLEIFIDEDKSGGEHTFNNNGWAYHLTTSGHPVDYGMNSNWSAQTFDDHFNYKWVKTGDTTYTWEGEIKIFSADYNEKTNIIDPVKLSAGKKIGFSMAYCDNDNGTSNPKRDHFMSSNDIPDSVINETKSMANFDANNPKNIAWINASAFGTLILK